MKNNAISKTDATIINLKAENLRLKKQIDIMHDNGLGESWVEKFGLKKCKEQRDALRKALGKYGTHTEECMVYRPISTNAISGTCTCGFEQALKGE